MDISQILEELAYDLGELPREAIESAVLHRVSITPYLLEILEDAIERVDDIMAEDSYQGHLYAMYLLAQFREKRAYPLILRLFEGPGDAHRIAGDVLTEDLSRILASICDSNIQPIKDVIENPAINEYTRAACLQALVILVGCGLRSRLEILRYFQSLLEERLERKPSFIWTALVSSICDLYPDELFSYLPKIYEEGLVDSSCISLNDIAQILITQKDQHLFRLFSHAELIDDTVSEMEKWLSPKENIFLS